MKAINRLYKYIDFKGVKAIPFEKEIGLSNGYLGKQLKRSADLGEGVLNKIIENCPEINPEWLLTGKGEMLKENCIVHKVVDNEAIVYKELAEARLEIIALKDDKIAMLEKEIAELRYTVSSDPSLYINVAEPTPELIKTIKNLDK